MIQFASIAAAMAWWSQNVKPNSACCLLEGPHLYLAVEFHHKGKTYSRVIAR